MSALHNLMNHIDQELSDCRESAGKIKFTESDIESETKLQQFSIENISSLSFTEDESYNEFFASLDVLNEYKEMFEDIFSAASTPSRALRPSWQELNANQNFSKQEVSLSLFGITPETIDKEQNLTHLVSFIENCTKGKDCFEVVNSDCNLFDLQLEEPGDSENNVKSTTSHTAKSNASKSGKCQSQGITENVNLIPDVLQTNVNFPMMSNVSTNVTDADELHTFSALPSDVVNKQQILLQNKNNICDKSDFKMNEQVNLEVDKQSNFKVDEQTNLEVNEQTNLKVDEQTNLKVDEQTNLEVDEQTNLMMHKQTTFELDKQTNLEAAVKLPSSHSDTKDADVAGIECCDTSLINVSLSETYINDNDKSSMNVADENLETSLQSMSIVDVCDADLLSRDKHFTSCEISSGVSQNYQVECTKECVNDSSQNKIFERNKNATDRKAISGSTVFLFPVEANNLNSVELNKFKNVKCSAKLKQPTKSITKMNVSESACFSGELKPKDKYLGKSKSQHAEEVNTSVKVIPINKKASSDCLVENAFQLKLRQSYKIPKLNASKTRSSNLSNENIEKDNTNTKAKENVLVKGVSSQAVIPATLKKETRKMLIRNNDIKVMVSPIPEVSASATATVNSASTCKPIEFKLSDGDDQCDAGQIPKVKHYMIPFISKDPLENKDNEDPRWEELRQQSTDDARYRKVRELWQNVVVPDPNVNLTRHSRKLFVQACTNLSPRGKLGVVLDTVRRKLASMEGNRKRKREDDGLDTTTQHQPAKRRRLTLMDMTFSARHFDMCRQRVCRNYDDLCRSSDRCHSYARMRRLSDDYHKKLEQIRIGLAEAEKMQMLYSGLAGDTDGLDSVQCQRELQDIERLYASFRKYYNWAGNEFCTINA